MIKGMWEKTSERKIKQGRRERVEGKMGLVVDGGGGKGRRVGWGASPIRDEGNHGGGCGRNPNIKLTHQI